MGPLSSLGGTAHGVLPSQDMGAGLAVVPFMGLLETVAIAKAFGTAVLGSRTCVLRGVPVGVLGAGDVAVPRGTVGGTGLPVLSVVHGVGWQEGPQGAADPSPGQAAAPPTGGPALCMAGVCTGAERCLGLLGGCRDRSAGMGLLGWRVLG